VEVLVSDSVKSTVTSEAAAAQSYRDIMRMVNDHGYCVVTVRAGGRSLEQNNLYYAWTQEIADEVNRRNKTDFSKDEIHEKFKAMFLGYTEPKTIGSTEIPPQLRSTAKLTKGEMFHYMTQVEIWCIEAGIILSHPEDNEYYRTKMKHEGIE
jgi:hypothetical protein